MKKLLLWGLCAGALSLYACSGNSKTGQEGTAEDSVNTELNSALATQDSLNNLINDIMADMNQIKELESIVSTPELLTAAR